jgi:hypothetical protein
MNTFQNLYRFRRYYWWLYLIEVFERVNFETMLIAIRQKAWNYNSKINRWNYRRNAGGMEIRPIPNIFIFSRLDGLIRINFYILAFISILLITEYWSNVDIKLKNEIIRTLLLICTLLKYLPKQLCVWVSWLSSGVTAQSWSLRNFCVRQEDPSVSEGGRVLGNHYINFLIWHVT